MTPLEDAIDLLNALITDTLRHARDKTVPDMVRRLAREELAILHEIRLKVTQGLRQLEGDI